MKSLFLSISFGMLSLTSLAQEKYLMRGNEFLNKGLLDSAEHVFRTAIQADSGNLIYQNQLGLVLIQQKKYDEAEGVLSKVLKKDSVNDGALWYSGVGYFKTQKYKNAIMQFEKALPHLHKKSGQYYAANWYIGKAYAVLLRTTGITYKQTDRMFACYEEYIRLQPNAEDTAEIKEYIEKKKLRRPPPNVKLWVDM